LTPACRKPVLKCQIQKARHLLSSVLQADANAGTGPLARVRPLKPRPNRAGTKSVENPALRKASVPVAGARAMILDVFKNFIRNGG
jgi:hypothetical protein